MAEVDEFTERMFSRSGAERVPSRLEGRYGIQVAGLTELDLGVFRVDRQDQAQLGSPARRRRLNEALQYPDDDFARRRLRPTTTSSD